MRPFNHVNAKTVKEAGNVLKNSKGRAKLIAGGTDLLATLKDRVLPDYPETVINIKTIPGIRYIKEDAEGLKIGALATLEEIARSPIVKKKYKILAEAAQSVATPQIRRMGTIGGNLCQDVRCWYYRYPENFFYCTRKDGNYCNALTGENRFHSIFGAARVGTPPCASPTTPGNCPACRAPPGQGPSSTSPPTPWPRRHWRSMATCLPSDPCLNAGIVWHASVVFCISTVHPPQG